LYAAQFAARRSFDLGAAGHSHGLTSFSLVFDEPLSWPAFEQAMVVLAALRGSDLLRVKGLVAVAECRGPVVVHFVQRVAHPPIELRTGLKKIGARGWSSSPAACRVRRWRNSLPA